MATLVNGLGGSAGFGENSMPRNDDSPSISIDLSSAFAGGLNFFGTTYTSLFLNYNGSISFGSAVTSFSPTTITGGGVPIVAPFWGDVDIRNTTDPTPGTNLIWYDVDPATKSFTATWDTVGYYSGHNDKTNSFQVRLIAKDEPGDFDILFYYQSIGWLTGDASGGKNGTGGSMAHAGYSSGNGKNFFEITESGTTGMFGLPGLTNIGQAGVYLFEVRNGAVPLFTSAANTVDFNNLTEEQKASVVAGNDLYHGKGGSDAVTLPAPANYDQVVGKDKDGNDIKLNWQDTATFFTESVAGNNYLVIAAAGNHTIVAGGGNDTITIDGNGDNRITTGGGSTTIDLKSGGGDTTITGGTGQADITVETTGGAGDTKITAGDGTTSVKLALAGSGAATFTGGAGDTTIKIDVTGGTANNTVKAGTGKTDITIDTGSAAGNNDITAGAGDTTIKIDATGGTASNTIKAGTGKADITVETTGGSGKTSIIAGDGEISADITTSGSGDNSITTTGRATIKIDATQGAGKNTIVTGTGTIDIVSGTGANSIQANNPSLGNLAITIKSSGTESNTIELSGDTSSTISIIGAGTTVNTGAQRIHAKSAATTSIVTFDGNFTDAIVVGDDTVSNFFSLEIKNFSSTLELQSKVNILSLRMEKDGTVKLADGASAYINSVSNASTPNSRDVGTIDVGAHAKLELPSEFNGIVNLGTGSSTLSLATPSEFGFARSTATSNTLEFQLGALATGDKIILEGLNPTTQRVASATLGNFKLADGTSHLILDIGGITQIAVGSINGDNGDSNNAYFDVTQDQSDTVLTLKSGNNIDATVQGPFARSAHGVTGGGVKVGIIADSFGDDRAGYSRDWLNGVIPSVTIITDKQYGSSIHQDAGRAMAGIVHAIAPDAEIFFYSPSGAFDLATAIQELRKVCDVVVDSIHFGSTREYFSPLSSTISSAARRGLTLITGAGNDRPSLPIYGHAAHPDVITVAAMNLLAAPTLSAPNGRYLTAATDSYSSLGATGKPDVTGVDWGQSTLPLGPGPNPILGTSPAAASVAGIVALMMDANPLLKAQPKEVAKILEQTALPFGQASEAGAGLVQADRAVAMAVAQRQNFLDTSVSPVNSASLAVPDGLSPGAAAVQPTSAALSVPVGNAGTGVTVMMLVEMGQAVAVSGLPSFTLNSGGTFTYDAALSSPDQGRLLFTYTVAAAEQASLLAVTGFSGTVKDLSGADADFSPLIGKSTGLTINSPLTATAVASSRTGQVMAGDALEITITLHHGASLVSAGGAPTLTLSVGTIAAFDAAKSDLAAGKLVFDYMVAAGQATPGLTIASLDLPSGSTIRDINGNNADFTLALDQNMGVQIGPAFVAAVLPEIELTAVGVGQTVEVTLALSQGVVVDLSKGAPTLVLGNGATASFDAAASDPTKGVLVFDYKVAAGNQPTANLLVSKVALNGATIRDAGGVDVDLGGAENAPTGLTIGSPLTVASTTPSKAGVLNLGETVKITLTMSTGLQALQANAGGLSTFTLNDGGTAFFDPTASDPATGKLVFDYTVAGADHSVANLAITQFNQNGGIYYDGTGNFADFSGALGVALDLQVVVPDPATATIAATSAAKAEGNAGTTAYSFAVTLDKALGSAVSMDWSVTGNATSSVDIVDFVSGGTMPGSTITFAAGETTKTITVDIQGDTTVESDEAFTVTLSNATGSVVLGTASAIGIVQNDDTLVSIAATDASKAEGNSGTTAFTFTLTRTGGASGTQSVAWSVAGSGAAPANSADFVGSVLPSGSTTFAVGETTKTIVINVQGDTVGEGNEGFAVTLANPSAGLTIGTASATGTIVSDDTAVSIAAASARKAEGNGGSTAFTFTLTRSGDSSSVQSVAWSVAGSGASPANAADFAGATLPGGSVTFAVGETTRTVTVNVQGDTQGESNEDFTVTLANASAGLAIGTASAIGTIQDDDTSVSIAATSASKAEGNTGTTAFTFTVTRSGSTSAVQSVAWSVAGSGANPATATDFTGNVLPTGSVTFATGETSKIVSIDVQGDTTSEPGESFAVTLANASAGLIIATANATGTIQNDDAGPLTVHDDAYVALRGSTIVVNAANGVLFNDDGSGLTASLKTAPTVGGLQLAADGSFTYTPLFGFAGVVTFAYHATSAGNSADGEGVLFVVPTVASPSSTTLDLLALTSEQQIAATYAAFFGRAADAGGFGFWVGEFNRLLPVQGPAALFANIASSFGISAEAKALYPFLANPFGASDGQISAFLDSVYNNLFNRSSDAGGLGYWTGEIRNALANNQFVGSVLVNIMSGAQDTAAGKDISTLMGKVAVSIDYVHEQQEHSTQWAGASDIAAATNLLHAVTSTPQSILTGIKTAETLIANHA